MTMDELTGLMTRAAVLDHLNTALAQAGSLEQPLAALYVDCYHLLKINNSYGHVAGDAFIHRVGEVIRQVTGERGSSGRIGGDEFLVVLPNCPVKEALGVAESIRTGVESRPLAWTHEGEPLELPIAVSIGVSYFPAEGAPFTSDELLRRAYEAVVRSKEDGAAAVCVYSELEERDPLTGVLRLTGVTARFAELVAGGRSSVAMINLDIDEFDGINKQYGRYTGDEVLRRVGRVLNSNFKAIGYVGRVAGDQFVVLLPDSRAETAFVLAEEVRRAVEDTPVEVRVGESKAGLTVHISGGVAESPSDGSDWESLLRKSDEALFRAKRLGRNRICLPVSSQMVTKTSHFTQTQLEKLAELAKKTGKTEAYLLREGLDDLLRKYEV